MLLIELFCMGLLFSLAESKSNMDKPTKEIDDDNGHQKSLERIMEFILAPYLILLEEIFPDNNNDDSYKIPILNAIENQPVNKFRLILPKMNGSG